MSMSWKKDDPENGGYDPNPKFLIKDNKSMDPDDPVFKHRKSFLDGVPPERRDKVEEFLFQN